MEKATLLVDLDPQANATSGAGGSPGGEAEKNIYRVLMAEIPAEEAVRGTDLPYLHLLPASEDLIGAEIELVSQEGRETRLREALRPLEGRYEVILIDCPPSLGLLTVNALCAARSVLIPLQCEYYALEGLGSLYRTIERIRESANPSLRVEGVLLTMFDPRNNLAHQVAAEARQRDGEPMEQNPDPMKKKVLGRGLSALLPGAAEREPDFLRIPVSEIRGSGQQPRRSFSPEELRDLVESVREKGVLQPVIVRPTAAGAGLAAGERRLRAAQAAGVGTIPAIVKKFADRESLEAALVENVQRADLNAIELAEAYRSA